MATALAFSMNSEFSKAISSEMRKCNDSKEYDSISRVHGQIDELKDIMVKNIENITSRGERLELLVNKTENLRNTVSCHQNYLLKQIILLNTFSLYHFDKLQGLWLGQCFGGTCECIF